jgi:hypothetical protein
MSDWLQHGQRMARPICTSLVRKELPQAQANTIVIVLPFG